MQVELIADLHIASCSDSILLASEAMFTNPVIFTFRVFCVTNEEKKRSSSITSGLNGSNSVADEDFSASFTLAVAA